MDPYSGLHDKLLQELAAAAASLDAGSGGGLSSGLRGLLDALPYYEDPDWVSAHRGALANLLALSLPNAAIVAHAEEDGPGYSASYRYGGPYTGYQDAFFHGVAESAAATSIASMSAPALDATFWSSYSVAVLTDAIRTKLSASVDTTKLSTSLGQYHQTFLPALSASCLAVYQSAFTPTATALATITRAGQSSAVAAELTGVMRSGQFTANVNQCIAMGGPSTDAAVWFLYQLWITLKALNAGDVDAIIGQLQTAGLTVPAEIGPKSWWNGGYSSFFVPLSGADVADPAGDMITTGMPETVSTGYSGSMEPSTSHQVESNGYSTSLCYWGSLSWYAPPTSSCFGRGTGVLLADGSVKPIERVVVGDVVHTNLGPRKVVLVESPRRAGRTLHRINGLDVFATAAHPFRAARATGPRRFALDPWALVDAVPTMIGGGVGTLAAGVALAGAGRDGAREVVVTEITPVPPNGEDELVHDLVLERWEKGHPTYHVGGPECFLAVDAEAADPMFDLPSAIAVVSALETALPSCRANVADPVHELSAHVASLSLGEHLRPAFKSAWDPTSARVDIRAMPGPSLYMRDGRWDSWASMLEAHLVRSFGRRLRRELATAWRGRRLEPEMADRLAVCVHDIELDGESGAPPGSAVEVEVCLRGVAPEHVPVRTLDFPASDQLRWHLVADRTLDFGRVPPWVRAAFLVGTVRARSAERSGGASVLLGRFRAAVRASPAGGTEEHFLFAPSGRVCGRIALDQRRVLGQDLTAESRLALGWSRHRVWAMAAALGRRLGRQLTARVER